MGKAAERDDTVDDAIDADDREERAQKARVPARAAGGASAQDQYQWSWLKNTYTIARREFWSYFDSPLAYVVLGLSLLALGAYFFFWQDNAFWQADRASMARMFSAFPVVLCFVCSVVTMRSLAEEKRMGTLELLITMPVRDSEVIIGKYLGALGLICVLLAASLLYPLAMFAWPWHLGPLDWGVVVTAYFGLVLFAAASIAVGLLFSSVTESQIIALFVTMAVLLLLYGFGLGETLFKGAVGDTLAFISSSSRYQPFARGLIDTRAVVYFLSITVLALLIAFRNLESRKWS